MGFELDRLLRQYGVSAPTLPSNATPEYAAAYRERMAQTPMYHQRQFQPVAPVFPPPDGGVRGGFQDYWAAPLPVQTVQPPPAAPAPPPQATPALPGLPGLGYIDAGGFGDGGAGGGIGIGGGGIGSGIGADGTDGGAGGTGGGGANSSGAVGADGTDGGAGGAGVGDGVGDGVGVGDGTGGVYARGGAVRFFEGGLNDADQRAGFDELAERYNTPLPPEPEPVPAQMAPAAAQPMDLQSMLARYMQPGASSYGAELAQARQRAQTETEAFNKMLQDAIKGSGEGGGPSKSEMYFRLAAAFADPGKTGSFGEGLGRAAGAMAEQQKAEREAKRAAARERLQLGLTAQQARMTGAREDVSSLRQLAGEEMKDKRAITAELLKEWTKRNDPVSTAGKQAQDEGLVPGTPQFQTRVREISELAVEKANAQIQATVAGMSVAAANLALGQARFTQQQTEAKRLTPSEVKLKTETEDSVAAADSAMRSLKQAYQLNPNTFDASVPDLAQRKILEAAGSKDPKLVNTRTMENLLSEQALAQLKTTFGAAPTEGERKILLDLQGIGAKSKDERAIIMRNAFKSLQSARERHQKRLNEINQGLYRDVGTPTAGGLE